MHFSQGAAQCFLVEKQRLGTLREAAALSRLVKGQGIKKLLVVSSGFHLRRAIGAIKHCCSHMELEITPVAVPLDSVEFAKSECASANERSSAISKEWVKHLFYQLLFFFRIPVR